MIDAEILFSRSPFVQESASQFTYIKPMLEIQKSIDLSDSINV